MKTKYLIPVLLPLFLCSCSARNYQGVYSFQLGKEDGRHMSAFLNLSNDIVYIVDDEGKPVEDESGNKTELGKAFTLTMSMNFDSGSYEIPEEILPEGDESDPASGDEIEPVVPGTEEGDTDIIIDGYYNLGESYRDGSKELLINVDLFGTYFDAAILESVIYAKITHKEVNMVIPVSIADLVLQLYWYGFDIDFANFAIVELPIEEHHAKGSHPKAEDIQRINDAGFADNHQVPSFLLDYLPYNFVFRDYNAVHIGLSKK